MEEKLRNIPVVSKMQLPIKAHYATLAMLALAQQFESRELLTARVIARDHRIPSQFLGQILQQLRAAGLITSTRGASGGFQLSRSPEQVSVADVVDAVCAPAPGKTCDDTSELAAVVLEVWDDLSRSQRSMLEKISLDDLLSRANTDAAHSMFYI